MKLVVGIFVFTVLGFGSSRFPSTVKGLQLPGTHLVEGTSDQPLVLRGEAPRNSDDIGALISFGVTDFLIFKNETKTEVSEEIARLKAAGVKENRIHHIAFLWKDLPDFKTTCLQTVEALKVIDTAVKKGRVIFFHCTVGEDRTGYLGALYRMLKEGISVRQAFDKEMCLYGYEAGNPQKPYSSVVKPIRDGLTPAFLKMAYKIAHGQLTLSKLSFSACHKKVDPSSPERFHLDASEWQPDEYQCAASPLFPND